MPARAPAKATVKVESELSTRRLCCTDGGCKGEKVGEMRGAAGLALGSPAGFMSTEGYEMDNVYDKGYSRINTCYNRLPIDRDFSYTRYVCGSKRREISF